MKELVSLIYAAVFFYTAAAFFMLFRKYRVAVLTFTAGFFLYTIFLISRAWLPSFFLINGILEGVYLTPWIMAFITISSAFFSKDREDAITAVIPVLCFSIFTAIYPKGIIPPTPNKITLWADIFFLAEASGHACFYLGGWFAALSIAGKNKSTDYHSLLLWGFVLFSISQVSGAIWAFMGWGSPFRWGARHFQSAVIWCYYAAYLHIRFLNGWSEMRRRVYAASGVITVVLCTFGSYLNEMGFPRIGW